jgi:hypothetical protein
MLISSAKRMRDIRGHLTEIAVAMELMKTQNKSGLNTAPWGTPSESGLNGEEEDLSTTRMLRSDRNA